METAARTILIVDDEFTMVETLEEILQWEGFRVTTAPNGREGLAAMERERPALVLVDMMMPVMDGLQMLEEIRRSERFQGIPTVLMTAAPMRLPAANRPWDELLIKPFGLDNLRRVLAALLPGDAPPKG